MLKSLSDAAGVRAALALTAWLATPHLASAQEADPFRPSAPAASTAQAGQGQPPDHTQPPVGVTEYPSLHLSGFADINFAEQDKTEGPRGFSEGQFVLHVASALSPRANFFGELSFTPRTDAGTGSPAAGGFNTEVERLIIRFDQSDVFKVSFGRYHTPVNWWNTAFHHGHWLQTTINRPEMIQFGGRFIPVHFVGALVEGTLPAGGWNVNYQAGIGNGRGTVLSRGGDAGDNNARAAWVLNLFTKPDSLFGLQVGGSLYFDRVSAAGAPEFDERITAAHVVWQREDPEVIAEIANVHHRRVGGASGESSLAYYVQTAYRLPLFNRAWKPYYRFEHLDIDAGDPVFDSLPRLDGSTIGVRYDISMYAAIKTEFRVRRRADDRPRNKGGFLQIAFTF
jgi:hypothetical protein